MEDTPVVSTGGDPDSDQIAGRPLETPTAVDGQLATTEGLEASLTLDIGSPAGSSSPGTAAQPGPTEAPGDPKGAAADEEDDEIEEITPAWARPPEAAAHRPEATAARSGAEVAPSHGPSTSGGAQQGPTGTPGDPNVGAAAEEEEDDEIEEITPAWARPPKGSPHPSPPPRPSGSTSGPPTTGSDDGVEAVPPPAVPRPPPRQGAGPLGSRPARGRGPAPPTAEPRRQQPKSAPGVTAVKEKPKPPLGKRRAADTTSTLLASGAPEVVVSDDDAAPPPAKAARAGLQPRPKRRPEPPPAALPSPPPATPLKAAPVPDDGLLRFRKCVRRPALVEEGPPLSEPSPTSAADGSGRSRTPPLPTPTACTTTTSFRPGCPGRPCTPPLPPPTACSSTAVCWLGCEPPLPPPGPPRSHPPPARVDVAPAAGPRPRGGGPGHAVFLRRQWEALLRLRQGQQPAAAANILCHPAPATRNVAPTLPPTRIIPFRRPPLAGGVAGQPASLCRAAETLARPDAACQRTAPLALEPLAPAEEEAEYPWR